MTDQIDIYDIVRIAVQAGDQVMDVYQSDDFAVEVKKDQSPLTLADRKSHAVIMAELEKRYPTIPVLSEEGKEQPYAKREKWKTLWLVDPLDGTKEFVKRNGEFTVNIALVREGKPVLGVIYAPVLDVVYFGQQGEGAWKVEQARQKLLDLGQDRTQHAERLPSATRKESFVAVASRSHLSAETEAYINRLQDKFGTVETTSIGSSLKLCLVAEGTADVYPRFAPTMEWDTAAGQAIVEASGGKVLQHGTDQDVVYNKENLLNPWFLAMNKHVEEEAIV